VLKLDFKNKIYTTFFEKRTDPIFVWEKKEDNFELIDSNDPAKSFLGINIKKNHIFKLEDLFKNFKILKDHLYECIKRQNNLKRILLLSPERRERKKIFLIETIYMNPNIIIMDTKGIESINFTKSKSSGQEEFLVDKKILWKLKKDSELLKNSEKKYEHLFENAPFYILLIDEEWNVVDCNHAVKTILGYEKKEIVGKNLREIGLIDFQRKKVLKKRTRELMDKQKLKSIEIQVKKKNGNKIWVRSQPSYINIGDKNLIQLFGQDISEEKRIQEKLRYQAKIVDNVSEAIISTDKNFNIKSWNKSAEKIYGWKEEEVIKKPVRQILKTEYIDYDRDESIEGLNKYGIWEREVIQRNKRGNKINISSSVSSIKGIDDEVIGYVGINRDITKQKKILKKLKLSEQKFRTLTEQSLLNVIILQDYEIKYFNQAFVKNLGYTLDEVSLWNFEDFTSIIHPDDKDFLVKQAIKKQFGEKKGVVNRYQFRILNKKKEVRWQELFSKTINYQGKPANFITSIDISPVKEAEKRLKDSEQKYKKAYELANFYKNLFTHDINNILQTLRSSLELTSMFIIQKKNTEKVLEFLDIMEQQITKGTKLLTNVQTLSNLENEFLNLKMVDVCKLLKESIKYIHKSFHMRNIDISVQTNLSRIMLKGNELLSEVFENIFINAIKYNENETVKIEVLVDEIKKDEKEWIKFQFKDNGIGIPDMRKEKIFTKNPQNKLESKGMGFGLTLVKKIIKSLKGKIWVENKIMNDFSQGANFVILFPKMP
jgi:PAS domain S-box-containing protein